MNFLGFGVGTAASAICQSPAGLGLRLPVSRKLLQEDQKSEPNAQFGELSSKTRFSRFRITLELEMLYELIRLSDLSWPRPGLSVHRLRALSFSWPRPCSPSQLDGPNR